MDYSVIPTSRYCTPPIQEFDTEKKAIEAAKKICKASTSIDYCTIYRDGERPLIVTQNHRTGRAKVTRY